MLPQSHVFEQVVSKPRLDSYRGYWKVNLDTAIGLYMWNGEVCGELSKLLSYLEISLRNSIHRELSLNASGGSSTSCHWWDIHASALKSEAKKQIKRVRDKAPAHVTLSPDEIVSRLTFGFWPNIFTWLAKQFPTLPPKVLPAHLLSLPGAAPNWFSLPDRHAACIELLEFSDTRNRIAHHEPLWKFSDVLDTSPVAPAPAILLCPASVDEASTFFRFARLLALLDRTVHALSPDLQANLVASSWRARLDFLLSPRGVQRFKDGCHVVQTPSMSVNSLRQQLAAVMQRNRPVKLFDHGGEGIFIPA
ncbi:hypothetical protein [Roseateles sp. BYS96W]|uniref:CAAX protease n=1 Tax=Pelomonas nitida TaxID=3299027 RepID=A0ABW7GCY9_9BURK